MGRIALVTGGTRGIGGAISQALTKVGHKVIAIYHHDENAAKEFAAINNITTFKMEVRDFDSCKDGVEALTKQFGPVEILVNNAGITRDATLHKMTYEQWNDVIQTNLTSCFNVTRQVIESMRERGFGRIINISSINGQKGQFGQSNYSASKAGILGFTKAVAQENATKGITVNAIAPGYIETDMVKNVPEQILNQIIGQIPVGRLGKPEEIAKAVVYLASDESSFITGATLSINGGQYYI